MVILTRRGLEKTYAAVGKKPWRAVGLRHVIHLSKIVLAIDSCNYCLRVQHMARFRGS